MIIRRLNIKNFGKIHDRTLELSPGINVLCQKEESEKTTVHTFIKSMFYGFTKMRKRSAQSDTYSAYEPCEDPEMYGGILWFRSKGQDYRLARNFRREHLFGELFNESTKELLDAEEDTIEKILGEASEAIYENAAIVSPLKGASSKDLARELQNQMAGYQAAVDSSTDLGRAMQMLKMSRKGFQVQQDKKNRERDSQQQKLMADMESVESEMDELRDRIAEIDEKEESLHMRPGDETAMVILEEKVAETRRKKNEFAVGMIAAAVAGILALIMTAAVSDSVLLSLAVSAVSVALVICCGMGQLKYARELQKRVRMKGRWLSRQEKLKWNKESIRQDYDEKETSLRNLREEFREYEEEFYRPDAEEMEIQALNLAMNTIERLSGNIHDHVGDRLMEHTSQILSEITEGKYREVLLDEEQRMAVMIGEQLIQIERLRRGAIEQIYFAMRMAAAEIFCEEESFPVILDDVFGMYEEERLTAVLRWMQKQKRQIILSTSSEREMELLDREKIPYQKLIL